MATIADLLARLEGRAAILGPPDTVSGLEGHVAGWMELAQPTLRTVSHLPTGGRASRVDAGLTAILLPLAKGPRPPLETQRVQGLSDLALLMGAISDVLVDNLRRQQRPEYVGREAAKLEAGLLTAVHLTARWSLGCVESLNLPLTHAATKSLLRDLVAVTEPWALIPPANRISVLAEFRIRTATTPGVVGAVTAWADEAVRVLNSQYGITSWGMQAIAASLAVISRAAHDQVERAVSHGDVSADAPNACQQLATSARAWRAAATWPPYLRLGGRAEDLRVLTRDLQQHLAAEPPQTIADTRTLLRLALPVAEAHSFAMDRLVYNHELWIHGPSLGPSAGYIPGWAREPSWSHQGLALMRTSEIAHQVLDQASVALATEAIEMSIRPLPPGWPPVRDLGMPVDDATQRPGRSRTILRGPDR